MSATDTVVSSPILEISGYTPISELGHGGMATVYLAIQECFGRKVALKVMAPALAVDPSFSERFLREAKIVARLSHPHIVAVYDVGVANGNHYIAMEYHAGGDLKKKIARGISTDESVLITKQLALALDYAHSKGYIHRDVKPDNILFREDGGAVLTDFGIARPTKRSQEMTQVGKVVGTPKYMSPEQAKGQELDSRADLYALGVMFFEMLAGHVPYDGDDAIAIGIQHLRDPVPELPDEVAAFQPIVNRLMAKDPKQRFQHGQEIISALETIEMDQHGQVVRARIDTISAKTPAQERNRIRLHAESIRADIKEQAQSQDKPAGHKGISVVISLLLIAAVMAGSVVLAPQYFASVEPLMALHRQLLGEPQLSPIKNQIVAQPASPQTEPGIDLNKPVSDKTAPPVPDNANAVAPPALTMDTQISPGDGAALNSNTLTDDAMTETETGKSPTENNLGTQVASSEQHNEPELIAPDVTAQPAQETVPQAAPVDPTIELVNKLLAQAEDAMAQQRLSKPAGESAIDKYRAVLALDPDNANAKAGIESIAQRYLDLSHAALEKQKTPQARNLLNQARSMSPQTGHIDTTIAARITATEKAIVRLEQQLEAQRLEAEKKHQIEKAARAAKERDEQNTAQADMLLNKVRITGLLRSAQVAFERNQLTSPVGDNAFEKYQQVLMLDKSNTSAKDGIQTITDRLLDQAQTAVNNRDFISAKTLLVEAIKVNPQDTRIAPLRKTVQDSGV